MFNKLVIACFFVTTIPGCGGQIGLPGGGGPPADQPAPGDGMTPGDNDGDNGDSDTPSNPDVGDNAAPRAVITSNVLFDRDIELNGGPDAIAFLFADESTDDDGDIVSYEWRIDATTVAIGPTARLDRFDIGTTRVTLIVTDNDGATGIADIDVINPGLRSGQWQGITEAGRTIAFTVDGFSVNDFTVGVLFNGSNILTGTPCIYDQLRDDCGNCSAPVSGCQFRTTFGSPDAISVIGQCSDNNPIAERIRGSVSASVTSSNCSGESGSISFTAEWISE